MSAVLIVAEHDGRTLHAGVARAVSCGLAIGADSLDVAVLGRDCGEVAQQAARIEGVSRVLHLDRSENANPLAAVQAPQLAALAEGGYSHVLGPSTTFGKDLMPRVAALLGVPQVSDIMSVEGERRFKRPIYAGNAVLTVEAPRRTCRGRDRAPGFMAILLRTAARLLSSRRRRTWNCRTIQAGWN